MINSCSFCTLPTHTTNLKLSTCNQCVCVCVRACACACACARVCARVRVRVRVCEGGSCNQTQNQHLQAMCVYASIKRNLHKMLGENKKIFVNKWRRDELLIFITFLNRKYLTTSTEGCWHTNVSYEYWSRLQCGLHQESTRFLSEATTPAIMLISSLSPTMMCSVFANGTLKKETLIGTTKNCTIFAGMVK